nr:glycoprotein-N-acetylgalactosamine 3-beta-galactosyltransferase [Tanacetum cinerariifolium]
MEDLVLLALGLVLFVYTLYCQDFSTVKTEVSTANTILVLLKAKESIIVWDPQVVSEPQVLKLWFRRNSLEELFFKEEMEQENIQTSATAKFPILKQVTQTIEGFSTPHIPGLVTTNEKIQKKNDVKKIVSELAVLGESISQEDLNLKFLRILPSEWNTHVVVWRNKSDLDKISIDDLYNNFKIVKQEVKRNAGPSPSSGSQNMAFVSTPSTSDNDDVSTVFGVSTVSPQVSTANLSDATVYAFLANQPNGSQLVHEDLKKIHKDDLEEMDLKWQLAMLSMRDNRNQETTRRTVNVEDTSSKAMVAIDGAGFDWSYMADDEAPTNMAFMAFSDSEELEGEDEVESPPEIERKTVEPSVDKHNMVAFLKKPQGSEEFHQIVDFLNASHIRRHLKLADADGISTLPTTEIFEQLALMRYVTDFDKLTFRKDEAITKEMHDRLRRATTTASSLEAEQGIGNISKTQTKATPSRPNSPRTSSKGGPGCHVTIGGSPLQDRPERLSNLPNEPPLREVTHLEVGRAAFITLTKKVKKLEEKLKYKRRRAVVDSSGDEEASMDKKDSPKQGKMIEEINEDENVNLVKSSKQGEAYEIARHKMKSDDNEVVDFSTDSPQKNDDEITLVEKLVNIKKSATKDKEIKMLFDRTKESIRKFVPMESEGQIADSEAGEGSSKEEKEYPLSRGALLTMLVQKLQVDEHNEIEEELLRKISMLAERPKTTPTISCKTLALSASLLLVFVVLLFSNQPNYFQTDIFQVTSRKSSSLPHESSNTNIYHLVFGLLGSTQAWHYQKPYIELWWRPNVTRGFLYLDTDPTNDLLPWSPASPPFRVSDDISNLLNEIKHVAPIMARMVHGVIEVFREEREGRGGLIMSYPLAKMVQKNVEDCFRRYPYLNSADLILMTCVNDFGVSMTAHQGLHQIDLRGDISGLFSSHPKAPLLSLHHIDHIDPLFRTMDRSEYSARHLIKAANIPLETFKPWSWRFKPPFYMFNTRPLSNDPCAAPHVFSFDSIKKINNHEVLTNYVRMASRGMPSCGLAGNHSADMVSRIEVLSPVTKPNQTQLLIAQKKEARIQLQVEEYDLMAAVANLVEIEELRILKKIGWLIIGGAGGGGGGDGCDGDSGFESRSHMLNKENYVPWSSRLLRYAKSRPNGKLIHNSIINGPYVRRMIPEPGDSNREVPVNETFHVQTDDELTEKEIKQIEADDQAIQTILFGLPEDIYAAEKNAKLFNEWERFTSNEGESIESYYHRFLKLMNDLKRNKHFSEKITSNLKFLNNLQPEWSWHVTIVHQTKDLYTADYTQLYDFLKYNQKENYMQQPMPNPKDITDPTTAMNMTLALMAKAFKLNNSTPTNNNQRISSNPRNWQIAQPGMNMGQDRQMQMVGGNGRNQFRQYAEQNAGNLNGYNDVQNVGNQNLNGNGNLVAARAEGNTAGNNGNQIRCYNCRGVGHFARNCTTDKAPIYDSDGSAEVHDYENCDDNVIFNMFTQEEQYTELLEPILESHQVTHNDNNVISEVTSVEQSRETVEQHPTNFEETRALYDSLYQNLAIEVEKVNTVNRKLKETNTDLTTELSRFKSQEKCFEISQEIYDKLERCYQQSVYQEQCLFKKINALHLSSEKKKLKSDFKTREDELLDKQIQLEKKIKELNNILVKT